MERILLANKLLQVLQDSHTAVSAYDWIWAMEKRHGTIPIRWAIEGRALGARFRSPRPAGRSARVLAINGREAELHRRRLGAVHDGRTQSFRHSAHRCAQHHPWVLGSTQQNSLTITWVDAESGLPTTKTFDAVPLRHARKAWAPISTRRPVVDWIFPDGSHLTQRDDKRFAKEDERLANSGRGRRIHTNWPGAATVKITSFSDGPWWSYHNRLAKGFDKAKSLGVPVVIDLRGEPRRPVAPHGIVVAACRENETAPPLRTRGQAEPHHRPSEWTVLQAFAEKVGGQTPRHLTRCPLHLHHGHPSPWRNGHLALQQTRGLAGCMERSGRRDHRWRVSPASVSFAGAIQSTNRGVLIGEPAWGLPMEPWAIPT